jgi:polyvinyl alcohol dehydrogenase (cytochrome)
MKEITLRIRALYLFTLLLLASGLAVIHPTFAAAPKNSDWPMWGYDLANHRYNPNESVITPANVSRLKPSWQFVFPNAEVASVPPTIIDGTLYVGSWNGSVYALDAATGKQRWTFSTGVTGKRGAVRVAILVSGDLVLFGDQLGRFFALHKDNGQLAWFQADMEKHPLAQITGSPVLYGDRIYVPMSSREEAAGGGATYPCCTFRGGLIALNISDGSVAWHFYTVDKPQPTTTNKNGAQNYSPSGASIHSTPAIDPDEGLIYVSTGESYTGPAAPHSDSIIALNLTDGSVRWAKQLTQGDWWNNGCDATPKVNCEGKHGAEIDIDFISAPMLWTIQTANGPRKLVGSAQKNGNFHALDALTGDVVWERSVGRTVSFIWGESYDGSRIYLGDATFRVNGGIYALDPTTGAIVWHIEHVICKATQPTQVCWSGHMNASTTPGLLWMGSMDGQLRAIESATGKILWTYNTSIKATGVNGVDGHGGSIGPGGVVVANGRVYVNSGYMPWGPWWLPGNTLMAFELAPGQTF